MTSFTGYVAYAKFTYGSNKGGIKQGQVIADPWMIYPRNEDNTNYSSQAVVESLDAANATYAPAWTPIVKGAFVDEGGVAHDAKFIAADDGAVTYLDASEDGTFNVTEAGRIAYQYDNIKIPANDLPHIGIEMDKITLEAKARRLAITYSQIAAFQYKTDYDADMQTALAEHAVAELKLEIDEEIIMFLANMGSKKENVIAEAEFNKKIPVGVAVADHYKSLIEKIDTLKTEIFTRTGRYGATFMLIDPSMRKYFSYLPDFKAAPVKGVIGAHFVGTLEGLKIYTTPRLNKTNKFFVGVKGEDFVAAAVYAPYMPIIPTQLLGYADGTMSQGFTTMYDLKAINEQLVVCGEVVDKDYPAITTKVGE